MSVLYTHSSRRLLLDVCNVPAASKLQRPVQQRLGGGGQECVQLLFTYSLYILTYLFTFVPLPTLLTLSNTGTCTLPITSGFPLSSLLLPAFSISQGENLSIHIVGFWGEMGRLEPDWVQPTFAFSTSIDNKFYLIYFPILSGVFGWVLMMASWIIFQQERVKGQFHIMSNPCMTNNHWGYPGILRTGRRKGTKWFPTSENGWAISN